MIKTSNGINGSLGYLGNFLVLKLCHGLIVSFFPLDSRSWDAKRKSAVFTLAPHAESCPSLLHSERWVLLPEVQRCLVHHQPARSWHRIIQKLLGLFVCTGTPSKDHPCFGLKAGLFFYASEIPKNSKPMDFHDVFSPGFFQGTSCRRISRSSVQSPVLSASWCHSPANLGSEMDPHRFIGRVINHLWSERFSIAGRPKSPGNSKRRECSACRRRASDYDQSSYQRCSRNECQWWSQDFGNQSGGPCPDKLMLQYIFLTQPQQLPVLNLFHLFFLIFQFWIPSFKVSTWDWLTDVTAVSHSALHLRTEDDGWRSCNGRKISQGTWLVPFPSSFPPNRETCPVRWLTNPYLTTSHQRQTPDNYHHESWLNYRRKRNNREGLSPHLEEILRQCTGRIRGWAFRQGQGVHHLSQKLRSSSRTWQKACCNKHVAENSAPAGWSWRGANSHAKGAMTAAKTSHPITNMCRFSQIFLATAWSLRFFWASSFAGNGNLMWHHSTWFNTWFDTSFNVIHNMI